MSCEREEWRDKVCVVLGKNGEEKKLCGHVMCFIKNKSEEWRDKFCVVLGPPLQEDLEFEKGEGWAIDEAGGINVVQEPYLLLSLQFHTTLALELANEKC